MINKIPSAIDERTQARNIFRQFRQIAAFLCHCFLLIIRDVSFLHKFCGFYRGSFVDVVVI
jgi:hypothetical protein